MTGDPHAYLALFAASAAAWLMLRAGLAKNALEARRKRRVCPTCGRIDDCACNRL